MIESELPLPGLYSWEGQKGWPSTQSNHKRLSMQQKLFYMQRQDDIQKTWSLLKPRQITSHNLVRIGKDQGPGEYGDGGYIMVDELLDQGNIAYSFGVGGTMDWEVDIRERGYQIHCYDPTVDGLPCPEEEQENLHFHKVGISGQETDTHITMATAIAANGHENEKNMLLQCDIEGHEWAAFATTPQKTLCQFSQILIEFHWLLRFSTDLQTLAHIQRVLKNLSKNFTPYHIHANTAVGYFMVNGKKVPEVIEISYVRNDLCEFSNESPTFPTELDRPNSKKPEIQIGKWGW